MSLNPRDNNVRYRVSPKASHLDVPRSLKKNDYNHTSSPNSRDLLYQKVSFSKNNFVPTKNISAIKTSNSSDFFNLLVHNIRRIDENFSIQWSDETPLQQALNAIISAIDVIEAERDDEYYRQPYQDSEDFYQNNERLCQLEEILKIKEENLNKEEENLMKEKKNIFLEKEKIKKLKYNYLELEKDLKSQKAALELREKEDTLKIQSIREELEKKLAEIDSKEQIIEIKANEIELLKNKLEEFNHSLLQEKEELELQRSKLFEKSLGLDKEKWDLENQKNALEEQSAFNSHYKEKINQELQTLESERSWILKSKVEIHAEMIKQSELATKLDHERLLLQEQQNSFLNEKLILAQQREMLTQEEERIAQILLDIEEEKRIMLKDKNFLEKDKIAIVEEREAVDDAWDEMEEKPEFRLNFKQIKTEQEYSELIEELQKQIVVYNKEIESKEREIELKNLLLAQREEEVESRLSEIQSVEFTLMKAKQDLEELSSGTIPELETQSLHIQKILADLSAKKSEIDSGFTQLQAEKDEFQKKKYSGKDTNEIKNLAIDLEFKCQKIRERENELNLLEATLEKEKQENLSHALYLQKIQKDFETSSAKKQAEMLQAGKRLESLQKKLEDAIALVNIKEAELSEMKKKINDENKNFHLSSDSESLSINTPDPS